MKNQQNVVFDAQWKSFYKIAGIAAVLIVLVGIIDILLSTQAGEAKANSVISVVDWFALFETNRIAALSNLGVINIITLTLGIPVYLALYNIHRRFSPAYAMLSAILFFIGTAIYISSNSVLPMLALSSQYAVAPDSQKPLLEAAGRAVLAQGADLTPGTFMGLLFTQIAGVIMAGVMLRSKIFTPLTAWFGMLGFGCMMIFFYLAAFAPELFGSAIIISMIGGLLLMAYYLLFARRFFEFGKN